MAGLVVDLAVRSQCKACDANLIAEETDVGSRSRSR